MWKLFLRSSLSNRLWALRTKVTYYLFLYTSTAWYVASQHQQKLVESITLFSVVPWILGAGTSHQHCICSGLTSCSLQLSTSHYFFSFYLRTSSRKGKTWPLFLSLRLFFFIKMKPKILNHKKTGFKPFLLEIEMRTDFLSLDLIYSFIMEYKLTSQKKYIQPEVIRWLMNEMLHNKTA